MHTLNYIKGEQKIMAHGKEDKSQKIDEMDQWLEKFFLDPLTSYFDETAFRIDLFETAEEYIVEALLPAYNPDDIEIILQSNIIRIQVNEEHSKLSTKERIIPFPFPVTGHKVTAEYHDDVLEVFIAKNKFYEEKNRKIPIAK
jgi:HSP20 family molecular chaperone IbpA